jgi:hypothetical protein
MRLATPLALGGGRYLESVSVGRDPEASTVRDCPGCEGYCYEDEWHLVATVLDRSERPRDRDSRAEFYWCSGDCLRGWLRLFPGT